MKVPYAKLSVAALALTPTEPPQRRARIREVGEYVSDQYQLAFKFEDTRKISHYDGAFSACNVGRVDNLPNYIYYPVKTFDPGAQTLSANGTVPQPLADCLFDKVLKAINSNDDSTGFLFAEIVLGAFGGVAACVAFFAVATCYGLCRVRRRPTMLNTNRQQNRSQPEALPLGTFPPVISIPPPAHVENYA